jgi:hypothetical protein
VQTVRFRGETDRSLLPANAVTALGSFGPFTHVEALLDN